MALTDEKRRCLVAIGQPNNIGDVPTIVIGIPEAAWDYMKDGKTHHFTFVSEGIPVQLMLFGGPDMPSVQATLVEAGAAPAPKSGLKDLGIPDPTKH